MGKKAQKRRQAKLDQWMAARAAAPKAKPGTVRAVTDAGFQRDVENADGLTLVDFWAPWCGPCKRIAPVVEELAKDYAGKVSFAKIDTEKNRDVPGRFGIRSIPSLLLFRNGEVIDRKVGAVPRADLAAMIDAHLS